MGNSRADSHPDCWYSVYLLLLHLKRNEAPASCCLEETGSGLGLSLPLTKGKINLHEKVKGYLSISFLPQQYVVKYNLFPGRIIYPVYVDNKLLPSTRS